MSIVRNTGSSNTSGSAAPDGRPVTLAVVRRCAFCKERLTRRKREPGPDWRQRKFCGRLCSNRWLSAETQRRRMEEFGLQQDRAAAPSDTLDFRQHNIIPPPSDGGTHRISKPDSRSYTGSSMAWTAGR